MEDDSLQLRDLAPAEPLLSHPGLPWWAWALIGAGVLLLVVTIASAIRRRRAQPPPIRQVDRERAYREAAEAIEQSAGLPRREAAQRVSGAIRLYLAKVCEDPSLFETHEEFLSRHEALNRFPESTREQVSMLLSRLAEEKYDRFGKSPATADFTERPLSVLGQVHQHSAA
jgi:hypothetical protein